MGLVELFVGAPRVGGPEEAEVGGVGAGGGGISESADGLGRRGRGFLLGWLESETFDLEEEEDLTRFGDGSIPHFSLPILDLDLPLVFLGCLGSLVSGCGEGISAV